MKSQILFLKLSLLSIFLLLTSISRAQLSYSTLDLDFDTFEWFSKSVNIQSGVVVGIGEVCASDCTKYLVYNESSGSAPVLESHKLRSLEGSVIDILVIDDLVWILSEGLDSDNYLLSQYNLADSSFHAIEIDSSYSTIAYKGTLYLVSDSVRLVLSERGVFSSCCVVSVDPNLRANYSFLVLDQIEGALENEVFKLDSFLYLIEMKEENDSVSYSLVQTPLNQSSSKIKLSPSFRGNALEPQLCIGKGGTEIVTNYAYYFLENTEFNSLFSLLDYSFRFSGYNGLLPSSPVIFDNQSFRSPHLGYSSMKMGYALLLDSGVNFPGYLSTTDESDRLSEQVLYFRRLISEDPCAEFGSIVKFEAISTSDSVGYNLFGSIDLVQGSASPCLERKIMPVCFALDSNFNLLPSGSSSITFSDQGIIADTCDYIALEPKWSYQEHSLSCNIEISTVNWLRDTLVGDRLASVIGKIDVNGSFVSGSELVVFYHNSTLEFLENERWKVYYSLNSFPVFGDTISMSIPANAALYDVSSNRDYFDVASSFRMSIDGVDGNGPSITGLLPATTIRYQVGGVVDSIDNFPPVLSKFIIGLGSNYGFFGQPELQLSQGCESELLCVSTVSGDFDIVPNGCNTATSTRGYPEVNRTILLSSVVVDGSILLAEDFFDYSIAVVNKLGQVIPSSRSGRQVMVSSLSAGVYTVVLSSKNTNTKYSQQFLVIK